MARPKTAYRNTIKSAVDDETYDGIRRYMRTYGIEIEARAISGSPEIRVGATNE